MSNCRSCGKSEFMNIREIKNFPKNLWPTKSYKKIEATINFNLDECSECNHVQLNDLSEQTVNEFYSGAYLNLAD